MHKGQGSMPNSGEGWHHAFQTGREGRLERETERERRVVVVVVGGQSIVHPLFRKRRSLSVGRSAD